MHESHRQQITASSSAANSAKYTNKDGSKFITIPQAFDSTESTVKSPAMAQTGTKTNAQAPNPIPATNGDPQPVNRKKQKRRQKNKAEQDARSAASLPNQSNPINGVANLSSNDRRTQATSPHSSLGDVYEGEHSKYNNADDPQMYYSDDEQDGHLTNGYSVPIVATSSKPGKKKGKSKNTVSGQGGAAQSKAAPLDPKISGQQRPPTSQTGMSKEKIWNTSSQEERERIKMFWLSLGEEERRSLVKVEKDAVLKKMKEQQKHSCSCTVCGRKRIAIEEELEVLYDAYYEELEQYANNQQGDGPPPLMGGSRRFGEMSGLQPPNRLPPAFNGRQPSRGKIVEHFGDDDDEGDEDYSEDELDGDEFVSDDEPAEEIQRSHATDFFNFGQSLTVQGGILTVADDLLKNDGKKFIEMMEQLAERRMAREEDAKEQQYPNGYPHPPNGMLQGNHSHHNHPPPPDDEEYDVEDDEDDEYDSQDEDYDEEEMDTMTEEQRMEEGRRMFQIFAARMFEQRVLTAYKEKVAKERQDKLLQELDEEKDAVMQKEAKKAKAAQKKKEKAQQKKQALAEEKARREVEKSTAEAAQRALEEEKAEETRLKAEEKRKKREAQKRAEDEERLKKEAEKQRRLQDQRERQAELERKQREAKERDKREKEEIRQKEKEAKEAKEKELRDRKEKQDREKRDLEMKAKAEKDAQEQTKRQVPQEIAVSAVNPPQVIKRLQQHISIPLPGGVPATQNHAQTHVPVALPALPKAPTPAKSSNSSQRDPTSSVPQTPQIGSVQSQSSSPNPPTPQQSSPIPSVQTGKGANQQPFLHHPQATSPMHSALKGPPSGFQHGQFPSMPPMPMNGYPPAMPGMNPGFGGRMHPDAMFAQPPMANPYRPLPGPNGMHMHPSLNGMPVQQGRGFPLQHAPPGFAPQMPPSGLSGHIPGQAFSSNKEPVPPHSHSRQHSASFEKPVFDNAQAHHIGRPAPIGRPSSVVQGQRIGEPGQMSMYDIDDLSSHLGSSALLDDSDEPLVTAPGARRSSNAPGTIGRQGFGPAVPYGLDSSTFSSPMTSYNTWGVPANPFGTSAPGASYNSGWGNTPASSFGAVGASSGRSSQPRSVIIRMMLCRACKNLEGSSLDGFHSIDAIRDQMERLSPILLEQVISDKELLDLCETEGNSNNGGGYFDVRNEIGGRLSIRFEPDIPSMQRPLGAPGDIGSPVVGGSGHIRYPGPPGLPAPGGF